MNIKSKLPAIRADLDAALVAIAKKHGLQQLKTGGIKYTDGGSFTASVEGIAEGGTSKEGQRYEDLRIYTAGLPELGAKIRLASQSGTRDYTVYGCNTTGSKIICTGEEGKQWLFGVDHVRNAATAQKLPVSKGPDFTNARVDAPR